MAHMQQQYQQQQPQQSTTTATQPIVSLSPFLGTNWAVRARVTDKGAVRTWDKGSDNKGSLLSFTLLDDSGSIRATFFGKGDRNEIPQLNDKLVNGQIFVFNGGQIKNANKRFSSVNNDYEVTFGGLNNVSGPIQDSANDIPQDRYNFLPLSALPSREKDTLIDVVFYVKEVEQPREFQAKASGKTMTKRTILVADKTAIAEITLWNDDAINCSISQGKGYILKGAKVGNYQGAASLGVWNLGDSLRELNGSEDSAITAEVNLARDAVNSGVELQNVSKVDSSNYTGDFTRVPRRHFDDIQRLNLGTDPSKTAGDSIDVRCIPTFIKTESLHYTACNKCNRKVTQTPTAWVCPGPNCAGNTIVMEEKYMVSIQASDGVAQTWITLFNDAGKDFFGMTAHELFQRKDGQDGNAWLTTHCLSLLYKPVIFRLKVKQEMRGDNNELRMNISANRCTKLETDAHYSNEIEKLDEFIALYENAPDAMSPNRVY